MCRVGPRMQFNGAGQGDNCRSPDPVRHFETRNRFRRLLSVAHAHGPIEALHCRSNALEAQQVFVGAGLDRSREPQPAAYGERSPLVERFLLCAEE